jgi:hypothetical protein
MFDRERGFAAAEAAIDLLQGDYIGIDLADDVEDARGLALPVEADALADVVGGNLEHEWR